MFLSVQCRVSSQTLKGSSSTGKNQYSQSLQNLQKRHETSKNVLKVLTFNQFTNVDTRSLSRYFNAITRRISTVKTGQEKIDEVTWELQMAVL